MLTVDPFLRLTNWMFRIFDYLYHSLLSFGTCHIYHSCPPMGETTDGVNSQWLRDDRCAMVNPTRLQFSEHNDDGYLHRDLDDEIPWLSLAVSRLEIR